MSQEETAKNTDNADRAAANAPLDIATSEGPAELPEPASNEEIDNLPIESIGSYGRIEQLMNEETEYPEEGDIEK
ncbi:MAG TPA: hypothetical protein VF692_03780 [Pyrinomonadaceae bacterium]|jgi:hypothetical protein